MSPESLERNRLIQQELDNGTTLVLPFERALGRGALGEVIDYAPEGIESIITLGSIVDVIYGDNPDIVKLLTTGDTRNLPPDVIDQFGLDPSTEGAPISSPVGQAVFNRQAGDKVLLSIDGRNSTTLTIENVLQLKPSDFADKPDEKLSTIGQ